jgi:hypothetical protein
LTAFLICLTSANMSFGIFIIPFHYRVSIYGANLIGVLGSSRSAVKSITTHVRCYLKTQRRKAKTGLALNCDSIPLHAATNCLE